MGAAQSTDEVVASLPDLNEAVGAPQADVKTTVLYKFRLSGGSSGAWTAGSNNASWRFYDANEGSSSKTAWYLEVEAGDLDLLVSENTEMQVDMGNQTATFYDPESGTVCKLRFPTLHEAQEFSDAYHNKLYENLNSQGASELGKAGDWFFRSADVEPMDWDVTEEVPPGPSGSEAQWRETQARTSPAAAVHAVAMGAGENSFLVEDNRIGVLTNDYGAVLDSGRGFALTPPRRSRASLGASGVQSFTPSKVMLMDGETQMNMLTPVRREAVVQADLASGRVVREWACALNGVEVPMADITQDARAAQLDHRSTFLGLDANRLCRWDQRTARGVVEDVSAAADLAFVAGKDYSRGTNFTCMATSGDGYVAVGSRDGRVRLFGSRKGMESFEFKQASTSVPGLGLPITAIDVSFDARYVVATTDKYVLVVQTFFKDARGNDTNGFVSRMGSQTPPPKLLKLAPEDRLRVGASSKFSKGRLTWITDNDRTERWIAASCGNFTVLWNFRRVKAQRPSVISSGAFTITEHYTLMRQDERVVDTAFLHDRFAVTPQARNALLVATEHQLYNCVDEGTGMQ